MPDPNEIPVPGPGEPVDVDRLVREGNELARELTQLEYPGRRPIDPESGPGHYKEASRYAYEAAEALRSEDPARAQTLAAIGQIHATLAAAAATAVQDHVTELDWRDVTRST